MKKETFILGLAICLALFTPQKINAGSFGGKVTSIKYCTCFFDPATVLTIDDYKSKNTIKLKYSVISSKLYKYYNVFSTGQYVLGSYSFGNNTCQNTVSVWPPLCESDGSFADGVINRSPGVGTSLK